MSWGRKSTTSIKSQKRLNDIPDHTQMLGPRPTGMRPHAQAAWHHACLQVDRYLTRRLQHLNEHELAELDARQQDLIIDQPPFDPNELHEAQRALAAANRPWRTSAGATLQDVDVVRDHARRRVQRLERLAEAHHDWQRDAARAMATRRQIALERRQRQPRTATLVALTHAR